MGIVGNGFGVNRGLRKKLGRNTDSYNATKAFLEDALPPLLSFNRAFSAIPGHRLLPTFLGLHHIVRTPDAYSKLTDKNVNLQAVFETVTNRQDQQKIINNLRLDKWDRPIDLRTLHTLRKICADNHLNDNMLKKATVHDNNFRRKSFSLFHSKGSLVNLQPDAWESINPRNLQGTQNTMFDNVERLLKSFNPDERTKLLNRFNFKKVKLTPENFERLDKLATANGLDMFKDLHVKAKKICKLRLNDHQFADKIVDALEHNKPIDLRCCDISKCDRFKAFELAQTKLYQNALGATPPQQPKHVADLKVETKLLQGSKMNKMQFAGANIMLKNQGQRELNKTECAVRTPFVKPLGKLAVKGIVAAAKAIGIGYEAVKTGAEHTSIAATNWVQRVRSDALAQQKQLFADAVRDREERSKSFTQRIDKDRARDSDLPPGVVASIPAR